MKDRELLELAAKAAGIDVTWERGQDCPERVELFRGHLANYEPWDPLNDDGDALRLAGEIKTCIDIEADEVVVYYAVGKYVREVPAAEGTIHAAMRRAIVRAAAHMEIFKEAQ